MPAKVIENDDLLLKMLEVSDRQAINILYQKHHTFLFNIIQGIVEDPETAKDILQDLFIVLWEHRYSLNITKPVKAYLVKAAIHRSLNFLRDSKKNKIIHFQDQKSFDRLKRDHNTGNPMEVDELKNLIKSYISSLPPKSKIVFILSRNDRMTYQESASYLGISKKAVEKRISKALKHLRSKLRPYLKSLLLFFLQ